MDVVNDWMKENAVSGREVFVTADNRAAVKLYEGFGYRMIDYRMLGAMP